MRIIIKTKYLICVSSQYKYYGKHVIDTIHISYMTQET